MKKINIFSILFLTILIAMSPSFVYAFNFLLADVVGADLYKVRDLRLDTKGQVLKLYTSDKNQGSLSEYSVLGIKVKDWKIDYELKGHSRGQCDPPMLNISFDKKDSKGNPKELFTGYSSYSNDKKLQYQKVRLIPDCDVWNDYGIFGSDVGFGGQIKPNLREFIVHKIFREFGVYTPDVVGFTNLTFISPEPKYNGKTFRYLIIQRPDEQDDQVPFIKQFNLTSIPYVSGDNVLWQLQGWKDSLVGNAIVNTSTKEVKNVEFEPISTIRFSLLTDFTNLGDVGFLHNDDGGIDAKTGKVIRIPHGFDYSFDCGIDDSVKFINTFRKIDDIENIDTKQSFSRETYRIARELFNGRANLSKMLSFVDDYPYNDSNKAKLKDFLSIKYYAYSKYVNSPDFAKDLKQTFQSNNGKYVLPFNSPKEYEDAKTKFVNNCSVNKVPLKGVSISLLKKGEWKVVGLDQLPGQSKVYKATFDINIKTDSAGLELAKKGSFNTVLVDEKRVSLDDSDKEFSSDIELVSGLEDTAGPYFLIPPNSSVVLRVSSEVDEGSIIGSDYHAVIKSFVPNYHTLPTELKYVSDSIKFGILEPITVISPTQNESLKMGDKYTIKWTGLKNRSMELAIVDSNNLNYQLNSSEIITDNNSFEWIVGNYQSYGPDGVLQPQNNIIPGKYRIVVRDIWSGISNESDKNTVVYFNVVDPKNPPPQISSIKPLEFYSGGILTITGINFSKNTSNIVSFKSTSPNLECPVGYTCVGSNIRKYEVLSEDGKTITFTVPDLPNGEYELSVSVSGAGESNSIKVKVLQSVPTLAEVIKDPVLKLVLDKTGDEVDAVSLYSIKITAGSVDEKLYKQYAFGSYVSNNSGSFTSRTQIYSKPDGVIDSDPDFYTIPAGKSVVFDIESHFNVKVMFAGVYTGHMEQIYLANRIINLKDKTNTNSLAIIGEQSPFINSIWNTKNANQKNIQFAVGDTMKINGIRFPIATDSNIVFYPTGQNCARYNQCRISSKYAIRSKDGNNYDFIIPKIFDGPYYIQVVDDKTGGSNVFEIAITGKKVLQDNIPQKENLPQKSYPINIPVISNQVNPTPTPTTSPVMIVTPSPTPTASVLTIPTITPTPTITNSPTPSPTTTSTPSPSVSPVSYTQSNTSNIFDWFRVLLNLF